jgi:hypothetical protein
LGLLLFDGIRNSSVLLLHDYFSFFALIFGLMINGVSQPLQFQMGRSMIRSFAFHLS